METLKDYTEYLLNNGYYFDDDTNSFTFLNGELVEVFFTNKESGKLIKLGCEFPDSLYDYLTEKYGEECEYDAMSDEVASRIIVTDAIIQSTIVNIAGFMDGSTNGIILIKNTNKSDYYEHPLTMFEKCVWIQNHETEHMYNIVNQHLKNIEFFNNNVKPLFENNFYNKYDSMLDLEEKQDSSPRFSWQRKEGTEYTEIEFTTDCITGEFSIFVPYGKDWLKENRHSVQFKNVINTFDENAFVEAVNNSVKHDEKICAMYKDGFSIYKSDEENFVLSK